MKHTVFNIQRFCVNDGPGIRTTVFLKGCMLDCIWCHNPESKSPKVQLMFHESRCIGCADCFATCPLSLHSIDESGMHIIDRDRCTACGKCVDNCVGALEMCGKQMSVDEILNEVLRDVSFYKNSGGGITVSGGDPLFRVDFTRELLKKSKGMGLHTCIETSGYAPWEHISSIAEYVDIFLWDVKETDRKRHKEYTGVSNELILENLKKLNDIGANIVLRCPIIPSYNDREEHLAAIGVLADTLSSVNLIELEPFHPMGISKCAAIGQKSPIIDESFPEDECVENWIETVKRHTKKQVRRA